AAEIAERLERDWDFLVTSLRDVPLRHRSLRVVFESSWQRLTPALRDVYVALAVLSTPFDADDAAAVAGATPEQLSALERRSLLQEFGGGRL
ncbi:hypothetical protein, partial [Deinococcus pimensis]|uniref:hypothetical protein n=1 Tax=Deinococcus pimensis TaxID=309888 RepID=UPI0005EBDD47